MRKNYDVVIIDSGFNIQEGTLVDGISIENQNGEFVIGNNLSDQVGHGTIIHTVICKKIKSEKVFCIKLANGQQGENDINSLLLALEYVKKNISCKIINISLGIKTDENLKALYNICAELASLGIVIVAAFDNEGCHSFPAAFDCVIGVDSKSDISNIVEIDYVEGSPINVFAKGNIQRLKMNDNSILLVGGASIACAYATSMLGEITEKINLESALSYLKKKARYIYSTQYKNKRNNKLPFKIQKAIVFPFVKESHAFLRFADLLSFDIVAYYDVKRSGKVGRKLSSYYEGVSDDEIIMDVESIDFAGIDTLILGHLDELIYATKRNYREELINKAIQFGVNIYSYDPITQYEERILKSSSSFFCPMLTQEDIPQNSFGKLYKISCPVVGIFGTSSKQGKFSLQLALKREFEKRNYRIGAIGTEPHSLLFGCDAVFPMGYNSTVSLHNNEIVLYLNNEIHKLSFEERELVIVASQAQTIPYYCNNLLEFPPMQYQFALGINPDAIVLCFNYYDEIDYIRNTIYTLTGLVDSTVVALVMYPITYASDWNGVYGNSKYRISEEEFTQKSNELMAEFNIPVYLLGDKNHLEDLCQNIINFF